MKKIIFEGEYSGESIIDLSEDLNYMNMDDIPVDEYNIQLGTFKVTVEWIPDDEA